MTRDENLETMLQRWAAAMVARDLEGVMRLGHPEIRLAMHFGDVPVPFLGVTHGLDAARRRTAQVFASWLFSDSDFQVLSIAGNEVRARWSVTMRHRWTGFSMDVKVRQVFQCENGLIRSYDAYVDAPRFSAFMKLVGLAPAKTSTPASNR